MRRLFNVGRFKNLELSFSTLKGAGAYESASDHEIKNQGRGRRQYASPGGHDSNGTRPVRSQVYQNTTEG